MIEAWFDGACWPNPGGPAAWGALVKEDGKEIYSGTGFLDNGKTSNNVAEYSGLLLALVYLCDQRISEATIYGDSNLVIQQMSGNWQIKHKNKPYALYALLAKDLVASLNLTFKWIPREQNTEADALSNAPLIERGFRNPRP